MLQLRPDVAYSMRRLEVPTSHLAQCMKTPSIILNIMGRIALDIEI